MVFAVGHAVVLITVSKESSVIASVWRWLPVTTLVQQLMHVPHLPGLHFCCSAGIIAAIRYLLKHDPELFKPTAPVQDPQGRDMQQDTGGLSLKNIPFRCIFICISPRQYMVLFMHVPGKMFHIRADKQCSTSARLCCLFCLSMQVKLHASGRTW